MKNAVSSRERIAQERVFIYLKKKTAIVISDIIFFGAVIDATAHFTETI